jgi:hypothetical protein
MDQAIKAQWTAALRSGEYQQGTGQLRADDADGTPWFCCLGVLCELAVKAGVIPIPSAASTRMDYWYGEGDEENNATLPPRVHDWAGLGSEAFPDNPLVTVREVGGKTSHVLAELNDALCPFSEIADLIDEQF